MLFKRLTLIVAGCLVFGPAAAEDIYPDFEAEYVLRSKGLEVAHIKRSVERLNNGDYRYLSRSETVGVVSLFRDDKIIEESRWKNTADGFQPIYYRYDHSGRKKNRQVNIEFDWNNNTVHMQVNENTWQTELEPLTLDKLLYQLAIMRDLSAGRDSINYKVADGGKIKDYAFEILGEETVETPYGSFKTVKVERHRNDTERETVFWCAVELGYLPIKIVHTEPDGLQTTTLLTSYKMHETGLRKTRALSD
ncbi:MAG: DUF3108 domain-containing protein [Gammaproteobacteria bacterium]